MRTTVPGFRHLREWLQRRETAPRHDQGAEVVTAVFVDQRGSQASSDRLRTLGAFGGVFTPSFLTIIGVIMYLRFSWVLGNAGLMGTLLIVVIANSITLVTSLSMASISSNEQMETGGAYFMVSRVFGLQAGGGIGIPLFLSQALSIALYVIGFAEALTAIRADLSIPVVAIVTMLILALLGLIGARFMIIIQYGILLVIIASFVSIAMGFQPAFLQANLQPAYEEGLAFWSVFAVFFPAVTGILAGVSMSGDLKDPARDIPRGTLFAVGAGFLVYILVPVMLAFTVPREGLAVSTALRDASRWPLLVTAGVMGATLSSAIGMLMAAPRTLQALAIDGAVSRIFASGVGKTKEPLVGMVFSMGLAVGAIILGSLNQVAEILTMFFLTTYGVLNLSAGMEHIVDNPSFRPAVRVPWWISFAGALACFAVMFLINTLATVMAITAIVAIFAWLRFRGGNSTGVGSTPHTGIWEGFWTSLVVGAYRRLSRNRTGSAKNWRPLIQLFAEDPEAHGELIATAASLSKQGGALAIYAMLPRNDNAAGAQQRRRRVVEELQTFTRETIQPHVEARVVETNVFNEGVIVAAQAASSAAGAYNTVILGIPRKSDSDREFARLLVGLGEIDRNILLLKRGSRTWLSVAGPILVWWGGQENNVRLMLILAYLLRTTSGPAREIHLRTIVPSIENRATAETRLQTTLADLRLTARTTVVVNSDNQPIPEVLAQHSRDAALVLLGMAKPDAAGLKTYVPRLRETSAGLESVLFVMNNVPEITYI
ncbi:MAG: amino acid permease [Alkalispirochaeta sp.]